MPGWFYGFVGFAIFFGLFAQLFIPRPYQYAGRWAVLIVILIRLGAFVLELLDDFHDRPIRLAESAMEDAKEEARRRELLHRVMDRPLEPIVASGFVPKRGEICYWAEPNVMSQDAIPGSLYVTNERLVFVTRAGAHSFALDAIVGIDRYTDGVRVDLNNSPAIGFNCGDNAIGVVLQRIKLGYIDNVPDGALPKSAQVVLLICGPQKPRVIKIVREVTHCSLTEAADFVNNTPRAFPRSASIQIAEALAARLKAAGATTELQ